MRPGLGTSAEARTGAGAAAFVLGTEGGAASLVARVTRSRPLVDRYRGDGEHATRDLYDNRLFREEIFLPVTTEVGGALASFAPRAWSLPDPDGRIGRVLSRRLGADMKPPLLKEMCRTIPFADLPGVFDDFIHARVTRRVVVDLSD